MSLANILAAELPTDKQMRGVAGGACSKGARTRDELVLAVLVALGTQGEKAFAKLPDTAQRKIKSAPAAKRELERIESAATDCCNWRDLQHVLQRFPPAVLFQILMEEMTATTMKALVGKERSTGAKGKDDLVFGVLLSLAERGGKALQELPPNAQQRIEAAPGAVDWFKMLERADADVLAKLKTWEDFRTTLRTPPGGDEAEVDGDAGEEEEDEEEEEEECATGVPVTGPSLSFDANEFYPDVKPSTPAKKSGGSKDEDGDGEADGDGAAAASSGGPAAVVRRPLSPPSWNTVLLEALCSLLLPFFFVGVAVHISGKMPGKVGCRHNLYTPAAPTPLCAK